MTQAHPPTRHRDLNGRGFSRAAGLHHKESEIGALREENAELRRLVIELSKLVIRNVLERHH